MQSWKDLKISFIETGNDLNSLKKNSAIQNDSNNGKSSHGRKSNKQKCTTTTVGKKRRGLGEVSIRPPWVGNEIQMNELAGGDSNADSNILNENSKKVPTNDVRKSKQAMMDQICERLHKGIRAKVEGIPKPKVPKILEVNVSPVIAPEVMVQIQESYNKRLAALQPPKRPVRAYHQMFEGMNTNSMDGMQAAINLSHYNRHVDPGRRTKFMQPRGRCDGLDINRCNENSYYEMPRTSPSLICSAWNPVSYLPGLHHDPR